MFVHHTMYFIKTLDRWLEKKSDTKENKTADRYPKHVLETYWQIFLDAHYSLLQFFFVYLELRAYKEHSRIDVPFFISQPGFHCLSTFKILSLRYNISLFYKLQT